MGIGDWLSVAACMRVSALRIDKDDDAWLSMDYEKVRVYTHSKTDRFKRNRFRA